MRLQTKLSARWPQRRSKRTDDGQHAETTCAGILPHQRELIEMAKTMDLAAIVKKTGRTPKSILITANRLGLSIKGRN
jgi:hypothetical protein